MASLPENMQAVRAHELGDPDVLQYETISRPDPGENDVLVRIHAASVNDLDCLVRRGFIGEPTLPWVPGHDLSGVIEVVGTDVTEYKEGDSVYGQVGPPQPGNTYAEFAAVPASNVVPVPDKLDHNEAAGLPMAGLAAWQALFDKGNLEEGQRILFHGAAGGIGHIAVQLANWKGATFIGTGSAHSEEYLYDLGVDEFVNYREENFEEVVDEVDVVIDTQGGDTRDRSFEVLKEGGRLVSLKGQPDEEKSEEYGVIPESVFAQPNTETLRRLNEVIEEGSLNLTISSVFPLEDARNAHELVEEGHTRGKCVLEVMN